MMMSIFKDSGYYLGVYVYTNLLKSWRSIMEKLDWYFVEELSNLESLTLVKCCGVVLSVIKEHSFVSFIGKLKLIVVSDSTGTL